MARIEPWEQQTDESDVAYQAFATYRDLGRGNRSNAKVSAQLGKSVALMNRWSSKWSWVLRASAWDRHEERIHHEQMRSLRLKAEKRNAQFAAAAVAVATRGLNTIAQKLGKEGAPDLTVMEVARLVEAAGRIEKTALGMADVVSVVGAPDGEARMNADQLTDEERALRLQTLLREGHSRLGEMGIEDDE